METWNTHKILEDNGGAASLHTKLKNRGHDITLHSVQAWVRRGNIPRDWLAVILAMNGENPREWINEDIF